MVEAQGGRYEEALARFKVVQEREQKLPLHGRCRSTLLTHGAQVEKAAVYFHGFTSCPAQGGLLASRLHGLGFNVYLPRMFGHGGLDPKRLSMAEFSVDKLVDLANESVDIACGLGRQVLVIGLSAGGTIASWVAQNRSDVEHVIGISPFFGPFMLPQQAVRAASQLLLKMPNLVIGWNPLANVAAEQIDYPFALPATHALAQIMVLGQQVQSAARQAPARAKRIGVLLNAADRSVSNRVTRILIDSWTREGKPVRVETLPLQHRLPHDIINPFERGNDFERVYATLSEMLTHSDG